MTLHPQAQGFLDAMAAEAPPPLYELTPEQARGVPAALAELIGPGPEVETVRDIAIPGPAGDIPARVYEPSADPPGTVVYYHGGGWVIGTLDSGTRSAAPSPSSRAAASSASTTGSRPSTRSRRRSTTRMRPSSGWRRNIAGGKPLVVAGDSAGGNLSAVMTLRARDRSGPKIALQVLVYPVVNWEPTGSYEKYGDMGLLLGVREMEWFRDHYLPNEADRTHPDCAPLLADDHSGLPPAYVLVAEYDPLRDEVFAYADKLRAAGVPVTVKHYEDQLHVFFTMVNVFESADEAVADVGEAIKAAVGAG